MGNHYFATGKQNPNYHHGEYKTRLYSIWRGMKKRCYHKTHCDYPRYGGRGIVVCNEWLHDYISFREWSLSNGYSDSLTLDRKDVNGNYEPNNCRWVTKQQQNDNRRNSIRLEHSGQCLTLKEWSQLLDIPVVTLRGRYRRGEPVEKILECRRR